MKALVAGGAGFVGSTLVDRLLAEGHAVDVVDDLSTGSLLNLADARAARSGALHIHQVDARGPEVVGLVERRAPDVVFQLTTVERPDVAADVAATVVSTLRLLEAARASGARKLVVLADVQIYGAGAGAEAPLSEADAGEPTTPHGVAQLAVVEYLRLYRELHGVDFTVLVADAVYGPRQASGLAVDAGRAALRGDPLPTSDASADLVFVDDIVDALVRSADRAGGLLLNVGWGRDVALRDLVALLADGAGRGESVTDGDVVRRAALDASRARLHLGWSPWTTAEEGVSRLLQWLHATAP